jgi:MinD superfamily P-loop ATPase
MPILAVTGAKGGCGASLVATNLALALTPYGETLLVDMHVGDAGDDLLLDLSSERSWADLLPVASELTERHLELACKCIRAGCASWPGGEASVTNPNTVAASCRCLVPASDGRFSICLAGRCCASRS